LRKKGHRQPFWWKVVLAV